MQRLWAPWRMKYIKEIGKKDEGCIFCSKPGVADDKNNLIVLRGEKCFIILNAFPYTNGHLLIVPYLHTSELEALDGPTSAELWKFVVLGKKALTKAYRPDGFNIGMNLGRSGGAGIEQHVHLHIVPRFDGFEGNFPGAARHLRHAVSAYSGAFRNPLRRLVRKIFPQTHFAVFKLRIGIPTYPLSGIAEYFVSPPVYLRAVRMAEDDDIAAACKILAGLLAVFFQNPLAYPTRRHFPARPGTK